MDGASEYGPRALGHRSLLAAPHAIEMRDRLNRDIKHREDFRPFAPVVTAEAGGSVFRIARRRRAARALHVGRVSRCGPSGRAELAAGDACGRIPRGCRCSSGAWRRGCTPCSRPTDRRRGIPVLLNTSFNVAGEPIVNAALEGYSTFRRCGIDALVAGPAVVTKRATASAKLAKEHVA
jgi:carbamoyltransferase